MYTIAEDIKKYRPVLTFARFIERRTLSFLRVSFFSIALISGLASAGFTITHSNSYAYTSLGFQG